MTLTIYIHVRYTFITMRKDERIHVADSIQCVVKYEHEHSLSNEYRSVWSTVDFVVLLLQSCRFLYVYLHIRMLQFLFCKIFIISNSFTQRLFMRYAILAELFFVLLLLVLDSLSIYSYSSVLFFLCFFRFSFYLFGHFKNIAGTPYQARKS